MTIAERLLGCLLLALDVLALPRPALIAPALRGCGPGRRAELGSPLVQEPSRAQLGDPESGLRRSARITTGRARPASQPVPA